MVDFPHDWKVSDSPEYIKIDAHNSNFRRGVEYRKIQLRNDGSYYMIFKHAVWNF